MARYFIGITGISTAGKSTLAATMLSDSITPKVFPIPHTTRREPRQDDDSRLIRTISVAEFATSEFLTVDQNYGTLMSDYVQFLDSEYSFAVSVVSCNEVPDLRKRVPVDNVIPIFICLTLTETLASEEAAIRKRLPYYFSGESLYGRIERDCDLAKHFFFNREYLESNRIISFSQDGGEILDWMNQLQRHVPLSYNWPLKREIEVMKAIRV